MTTTEPRELTERERAILHFEQQWFRYAGAKMDAVQEAFGLSPTGYHQALNALIDRPEAELEEPVLVHRLRRLRDARLARAHVRRPAG